MKNYRWWPIVGLTAAATLGLAGCGSSDNSSGDVSIRLANATITHPSLDFLVNSNVAQSAIAVDTASTTYVTPSAGAVTLQVNDAGGSTALTTSVPTLTSGLHYTVVAYESGGVVKTVLLNEDFTVPTTAGVATVRVADAAIEAGKLDVYITTNACTNISSLSPVGTFGATPTTFSLTQGAGSYNVCVTAQGSKTDLRMSMPITVTSLQVATILLTPASGGQLLNGSYLIQQGAYSAVRNTNTRVRLASAVDSAVTVGATSSDGTVVDSGSVAPSFGFYTLVPATSSVNVSVNGNPIGSTTTSLVAGSDMTLLVYGASGNPAISLITDDNRPPTDSTTTKLRLINGITGSTGNLTLVVNSTPIGVNIAPGAASAYATVAGSTTAMNMSLTSSTVGSFVANTSNILSANTTYSVLAVGNNPPASSSPQLLIR